jgi:hypothetical protein
VEWFEEAHTSTSALPLSRVGANPLTLPLGLGPHHRPQQSHSRREMESRSRRKSAP